VRSANEQFVHECAAATRSARPGWDRRTDCDSRTTLRWLTCRDCRSVHVLERDPALNSGAARGGFAQDTAPRGGCPSNTAAGGDMCGR